MLGAIAGDVIGSVFECTGFKKANFPLFSTNSRFTDDTVLTVAVAECLLEGGNYVETYHRYYDEFPGAGYGRSFRKWAQAKTREPYGSLGNGFTMRVSPVAYAFGAADMVEEHPECTDPVLPHGFISTP
jgi:ADP-ribosylglycohydrolase